MNKVIRDGKVAVLYSPGFGAGWYTWNQDHPELMFDPGIVDLLEAKNWEQLEAYVMLKWPNMYKGGMDDLRIRWLPEGSQFIIEENDGNETLVVKDEIDWFTA